MRFPLILLAPLLLLSGCSHSNYYAEKLKLPALEAPQKIGTISDDDTSTLSRVTSPIEQASTPAEADSAGVAVETFHSLAGAMDDSDPKDPPALAEKKRARNQQQDNIFQFLEQAAKIKAAQLADGDSKDSTGEVGLRIGYAQQSRANATEIDKDIPEKKSSSSSTAPTEAPAVATEPTTAPQGELGLPTATPEETPQTSSQSGSSDTPAPAPAN